MNRTQRQVETLVEAVQADVTDVVTLLVEARDKMHDLRDAVVGLNGMAPLLRGKAQELEKMMADLDEESRAVSRKLLGQSRTEIAQTVNTELLAAVRGHA